MFSQAPLTSLNRVADLSFMFMPSNSACTISASSFHSSTRIREAGFPSSIESEISPILMAHWFADSSVVCDSFRQERRLKTGMRLRRSPPDRTRVRPPSQVRPEHQSTILSKSCTGNVKGHGHDVTLLKGIVLSVTNRPLLLSRNGWFGLDPPAPTPLLDRRFLNALAIFDRLLLASSVLTFWLGRTVPSRTFQWLNVRECRTKGLS
ncbi:hypothetical protein V8E55_004285 [Tylopilus felleus]